VSICLLDTTVFCNILEVPGRDQDRDDVLEELRDLIEENWSLLLPIATIYETGNHIGQLANGDLRRASAERFSQQVADSFEGNAPWTPTPVPDEDEFVEWLADFPDAATRELGLGDHSIVKIFERQCEIHPARRVRVWSLDNHLMGLDRLP
jgi:hypothetical protein